MIEETEQKTWWEDLHIRHRIRIYGSLLLLLIGITDLILSYFGFGLWDMFSDLIWIIGAFGILGASIYIAIEMVGK